MTAAEVGPVACRSASSLVARQHPSGRGALLRRVPGARTGRTAGTWSPVLRASRPCSASGPPLRSAPGADPQPAMTAWLIRARRAFRGIRRPADGAARPSRRGRLARVHRRRALARPGGVVANTVRACPVFAPSVLDDQRVVRQPAGRVPSEFHHVDAANGFSGQDAGWHPVPLAAFRDDPVRLQHPSMLAVKLSGGSEVKRAAGHGTG